MAYRYDVHREFFGLLAYMEQQNFSSCRGQLSTERLEQAMKKLQEIIATGDLELNQFGGGKFRSQMMVTAVECMLLIYSHDDALS